MCKLKVLVFFLNDPNTIENSKLWCKDKKTFYFNAIMILLFFLLRFLKHVMMVSYYYNKITKN